jgi:phosphomannomutase
MSLMVSVSGVRGVVGEDFNPEVVMRYVRAFSTLLSKRGSSRTGAVVVGRDTRKSGGTLSLVTVGTLSALGVDTIDIGIAPTPTVLLSAREYGCSGGIAITASHNPEPWNALKFCTSRGLFLSADQVSTLQKGARENTFTWADAEGAGRLERRDDALRIHIERVLRHLNVSRIRERAFTVVVDPGGGTGAVVDREFLEELGCRVVGVNDRVSGSFPRGPEPVPANLGSLCEAVLRHHADVGFAQDPDADRLAVVTDAGRPIGEEYTLVLAGEAQLRKKKSAVVCNLSTSLMVDRLAERHGVTVERTSIGERNVTQRMLDTGAAFGGEGNGGVIVSSVNPCRDSLVGMGLILELLTGIDIPLSKFVEGLPSYCMMKTKRPFPEADRDSLTGRFLAEGHARFPEHRLTREDGIKFHNSSEWIHLRFSNTEPVIRVIAESPSRDRTEELVSWCTRTLDGM